MGLVTVAPLEFMGWKNCIKLQNGIVELIITLDIGPRIISYGFVGERNEFCVWEEQAGLTGGPEWRCYGGSRLWHGPEIGDRCYEPDNEPVEYEEIENGVILKQSTEPKVKMTKCTKIILAPGSTKVDLFYSITNDGAWSAELCIWALTLMKAGGTAIIPTPKQAVGLKPNGVLPIGAVAFWPYSSLTDSRFTIGDKYFKITHDANITQSFKVGLPLLDGWMGYLNDGHLFVKYYKHRQGETYPDFGSSFEGYCCERFVEVETLSPMKTLQPGETIHHKETWELFKDVQADTEEEIDKNILPIINIQ